MALTAHLSDKLTTRMIEIAMHFLFETCECDAPFCPKPTPGHVLYYESGLCYRGGQTHVHRLATQTLHSPAFRRDPGLSFGSEGTL